MRPQDGALYPDFVANVTANDMRLRMFMPVREFTPAMIERLTNFDTTRALALIAIDETTGRMLGVVRLHNDTGSETAEGTREISGEFAVLVRSALKGQGLGWLLMQAMIAAGRARGVTRIHGQVLRENVTMLQMCRELGFRIADDPSEPSVELVTLTTQAA